MSGPWLFASFFLGGFECSTHVTVEGRRLDIVAVTQHDKLEHFPSNPVHTLRQ
jgi:hypothetical protein